MLNDPNLKSNQISLVQQHISVLLKADAPRATEYCLPSSCTGEKGDEGEAHEKGQWSERKREQKGRKQKHEETKTRTD
jgi:hypothetical protein